MADWDGTKDDNESGEGREIVATAPITTVCTSSSSSGQLSVGHPPLELGERAQVLRFTEAVHDSCWGLGSRTSQSHLARDGWRW